jgi:hypothetical protein
VRLPAAAARRNYRDVLRLMTFIASTARALEPRHHLLILLLQISRRAGVCVGPVFFHSTAPRRPDSGAAAGWLGDNVSHCFCCHAMIYGVMLM